MFRHFHYLILIATLVVTASSVLAHPTLNDQIVKHLDVDVSKDEPEVWDQIKSQIDAITTKEGLNGKNDDGKLDGIYISAYHRSVCQTMYKNDKKNGFCYTWLVNDKGDLQLESATQWVDGMQWGLRVQIRMPILTDIESRTASVPESSGLQVICWSYTNASYKSAPGHTVVVQGGGIIDTGQTDNAGKGVGNWTRYLYKGGYKDIFKGIIPAAVMGDGPGGIPDSAWHNLSVSDLPKDVQRCFPKPGNSEESCVGVWEPSSDDLNAPQVP